MIKQFKNCMKRMFRFTFYTLLPIAGGGWVGVSCSDFLYDDSDQVIYADEEHLNSDADTLWSVAGIMNKMQVIADRTILLGELRGDLSDLTSSASADLHELADFDISSTNKYNSIRDYYAIINNCNYFLAHADTLLRNNRNELIFQKEYAAVKVFRAWTYLQMVLNYDSVDFVTTPIVTKDDADRHYATYHLKDVCDYFIADLTPYANVELPGYGSIRNNDSQLFYMPVYVLLGDLNLWAGNYTAAAENYYRYLSTHNGTNSAYPISTNAVEFINSDSRWRSVSDSWSLTSFGYELVSSNSELITMIPGDSIPSEGNYSELRDLFNSNQNNGYKESIVPSKALIDLSKAQKYCQYTSGGNFVYAPDGLSGNLNGDLRLQAVYSQTDNADLSIDGTAINHYSYITKYQTRNVHLYRRAMVYLRLAEALNRAGYPQFAFTILKKGVNNNVLESDVIPYYPESEAWLRTFNFPNTQYILRTTAGQSSENTIGLHSRGCGYADHDTTYVISGAANRIDSINKVEDMIMDEEALEFAFEGHRYYDLMRIALRRNDPAYLADRIAARKGTVDAALRTRLMDKKNWYLKR